VTQELQVGVSVHDSLMQADPDARRALLDGVEEAGLDHVTLGDHVSFHGGTGFDGLVSATAVLATHDRLRVLLGVYQLALRHPLVVARQLASLAQIAPGRLTLGVGVGGEDRAEVSNCGVDPSTRGRRVDESLGLLRRLAAGEAVDHVGELFTLEQAAVLPPPAPAVPLVVGGSGDAAVRRTAELGDGWLGIFCTARRFAETRGRILGAADAVGRDVSWFGVSVWCGFDDDATVARSRLGDTMQALYQLPPERFGHLAPAGTPRQVADFLAPYVEAGAGSVSVIPVAATAEEGVAAAGEVKRLLRLTEHR
jgi:alkanesulfonate monooxygenase SsuD/methylene tetrahydromethanopterin reductase-like flavin-dependent oxidoreductase (luciferase family)